jgi:pilus assembly protein Flp/PilA
MDIITSLKNTFVAFAQEEEGAQVVEYALVIALVSIGLALALQQAFGTGTGSAFNSLVTRVKSCFAANATSC